MSGHFLDTTLVSRQPGTVWNWRWESTSSCCSENARRAIADELPETSQHCFPCQERNSRTT